MKFYIVLLLIVANVLCRVVKKHQLPLRTSGRWIVDHHGNRVKLACINWHGAHMNTFAPSGLHFKSPRDIAKKIRSLNFNCVRLNWSLELVLRNPAVHAEAIRKMDRPRPKRALQVLDVVISALAAENVMVILDNHISDASWCCDPRDHNGLWFNDRYTVNDFERAWVRMAARYKDQPYVIACDLRNEIRPDVQIHQVPFRFPKVDLKLPGWGTGNITLPLKEYQKELAQFEHPDLKGVKQRALVLLLKNVIGNTQTQVFDWHTVSTRVGNAIMRANDKVIVIVQGIFDLHAQQPHPIMMILYYLKNDPELKKTVGKHFDIPNTVTQHYQIHNLTGVKTLPVVFDKPDRLVYTAHVYPFFYAGSQFSWNDTSPTYEKYSSVLDYNWGFIFKQEIAPIWIGETGNDSDETGMNGAWLNYTLRYLREHDLDFSYWPLAKARPTIDIYGKFHPGDDDYGLLDKNFDKLAYPPIYESFKDLLEPIIGPGVSTPSPKQPSIWKRIWDFISRIIFHRPSY